MSICRPASVSRCLPALLAAALLSCWPNQPPQTPARPAGPGRLTAGTPQYFSILPTDPDDELVACRFVWDGDTSDWSDWIPSGETTTTARVLRDTGAYSVCAQVKDPHEAVSGWSEPLAVLVVTNHLPAAPLEPEGPRSAQPYRDCQFVVMAPDPDSEETSCRLDWGDGDTSDWTSWLKPGEAAAVSHRWRRAGNYRIRAQARDRARNLSEWSPAHVMHIGSPPGSAAQPEGPLPPGRGTRLTFASWADDPDRDSIAIRFCWDLGDTSGWSQCVRSGDTVRMAHTWPQAGTYFITAQARDQYGDTSGWSDPARLEISVEDTLLRWCFVAGDDITTAPAVADDGTVYFGANDRYLYALNKDGTRRWRLAAGGSIRSSPAVGEDGTIYVGADDDYLYAVNPDGTLRWRIRAGGDVRSSPAIADDGTIYFGSEDDALYAVNPDGTLKWHFAAGGGVRSSPAVGLDGTVYFGADDDVLYALNPDSTVRWQLETGGNVRSSPAIGDDGTIYVGTDDQYLYAVNPDGTVRWRFFTDGDIESSPVVGPDGTVYFGSEDRYVYALNSDGSPRWLYPTEGGVRSVPTVGADGLVYVGSDDDNCYAFGPAGEPVWRFSTHGNVSSSPATAPEGTVYVGSNDGILYALKSAAGLAQAAWPKFRHDQKNTGRADGGR
jgi:outer membrane protein assembly factor BamB